MITQSRQAAKRRRDNHDSPLLGISRGASEVMLMYLLNERNQLG
jgi:hypothetical protein